MNRFCCLWMIASLTVAMLEAVARAQDAVPTPIVKSPLSADEALKGVFPLHRNEVPPLALVQNGETVQIADAETADTQTGRQYL